MRENIVLLPSVDTGMESVVALRDRIISNIHGSVTGITVHEIPEEHVAVKKLPQQEEKTGAFMEFGLEFGKEPKFPTSVIQYTREEAGGKILKFLIAVQRREELELGTLVEKKLDEGLICTEKAVMDDVRGRVPVFYNDGNASVPAVFPVCKNPVAVVLGLSSRTAIVLFSDISAEAEDVIYHGVRRLLSSRNNGVTAEMWSIGAIGKASEHVLELGIVTTDVKNTRPEDQDKGIDGGAWVRLNPLNINEKAQAFQYQVKAGPVTEIAWHIKKFGRNVTVFHANLFPASIDRRWLSANAGWIRTVLHAHGFDTTDQELIDKFIGRVRSGGFHDLCEQVVMAVQHWRETGQPFIREQGNPIVTWLNSAIEKGLISKWWFEGDPWWVPGQTIAYQFGWRLKAVFESPDGQRGTIFLVSLPSRVAETYERRPEATVYETKYEPTPEDEANFFSAVEHVLARPDVTRAQAEFPASFGKDVDPELAKRILGVRFNGSPSSARFELSKRVQNGGRAFRDELALLGEEAYRAGNSIKFVGEHAVILALRQFEQLKLISNWRIESDGKWQEGSFDQRVGQNGFRAKLIVRDGSHKYGQLYLVASDARVALTLKMGRKDTAVFQLCEKLNEAEFLQAIQRACAMPRRRPAPRQPFNRNDNRQQNYTGEEKRPQRNSDFKDIEEMFMEMAETE